MSKRQRGQSQATAAQAAISECSGRLVDPPQANAAMVEREECYLLSGTVQLDDAYLGGERRGDKAGRGLENKAPFVAAVSIDDEDRPQRIKLTPVSGFTTEVITAWSKSHLDADCTVFSDGLACFGGRQRRRLPPYAPCRQPMNYLSFAGLIR